MISSYITVDDVKEYGYQVDDVAVEGEGASDVAVLEKIIPRAARIFDLFARVEPGYFAAFQAAQGAPNQGATERVFYGNGTDFLFLPPYVGPLASGAITMPTGSSVPEFIERRDRDSNQYLQRKHAAQPLSLMDPTNWPFSAGQFYCGTPVSSGWPLVEIIVTAKWGFEAVPDDVKEAVLELTVAIWRSKDPAFAKVIRLDDKEIISQAMPDRTKQIAALYEKRRAVVEVAI